MTELLASIAGNFLLFSLVFGMSATVQVDNLKEQLCNKNAILVGIFSQFFLLPALGFTVVKIFDLEATVGVSLLVVTSSPGGSYSNWWCSMFNGDLALSVTMTAISTISSILFLPLNLIIYTSFSYDDDVVANLDWVALFLSLFVVIFAIFLGLSSSYILCNNTFRRWANMAGNIAGIGLMLFSATVTNTGDDVDSKIWARDWQFYVATFLPCALGLLFTNIIATLRNLKPAERVTVAIEAAYQNVGIGTSVALSMFSGADLNNAMGVPFFYAVVEIVLISAYCLIAWKIGWTKASPSDSFCKVLCTSYEVSKPESAYNKSAKRKSAPDAETVVEIASICDCENIAPVALADNV